MPRLVEKIENFFQRVESLEDGFTGISRLKDNVSKFAKILQHQEKKIETLSGSGNLLQNYHEKKEKIMDLSSEFIENVRNTRKIS